MTMSHKRTPGLSIVIVLLALSNVAGIFKLRAASMELAKLYNFLQPEQVAWLTILPIATLIALAGIWYGKRWGLMLAMIVFVMVLSLDLYYAVWTHAALALVSFAFLAFFFWRSRGYFGFGQRTAGDV